MIYLNLPFSINTNIIKKTCIYIRDFDILEVSIITNLFIKKRFSKVVISFEKKRYNNKSKTKKKWLRLNISSKKKIFC